jgi:hypothetical protein
VIIISHALSYMKNQGGAIRRALSLLHDGRGLIFAMSGLNHLQAIAPNYNPKYKPNRMIICHTIPYLITIDFLINSFLANQSHTKCLPNLNRQFTRWTQITPIVGECSR